MNERVRGHLAQHHASDQRRCSISCINYHHAYTIVVCQSRCGGRLEQQAIVSHRIYDRISFDCFIKCCCYCCRFICCAHGSLSWHSNFSRGLHVHYYYYTSTAIYELVVWAGYQQVRVQFCRRQDRRRGSDPSKCAATCVRSAEQSNVARGRPCVDLVTCHYDWLRVRISMQSRDSTTHCNSNKCVGQIDSVRPAAPESRGCQRTG